MLQKDNIREVIAEIQLHTIDNVLKNYTDRVANEITDIHNCSLQAFSQDYIPSSS